jgi:cupin 2 domain-containing protein
MPENLLQNLPDASAEEVIETLLESGPVRIERIVSHGQASPEGFWYDQEEDEWVVVLTGAAVVEVAGEEAPHQLQRPHRLEPGDTLYLPAHRRHRVTWTTPEAVTIWLAFFWTPEAR